MAKSRRITSGAILAPLGSGRSAAARWWTHRAKGRAEVAGNTGSALSGTAATRAASEAESGWPGGCTGVETAAGVHLGHFIAPARGAAFLAKRHAQLDVSRSESAPSARPRVRWVAARSLPWDPPSLEPPGRL